MIEEILGKKFSVSIAYISDQKMREINHRYRKIDKTTDILSFSLDKNLGEILISKKEAEKKARLFGMKNKDYLDYILIHGLLHLKGFEHGSIMERHEKRLCKLFGIRLPYFLDELNEQKNNSRARHRDIPSQSNSGRRSRRK